RAYGGPQYQLTRQVMERFAEAIQHSGVDLVPKIVIGGSSGGVGPDGKPTGNPALGANVMESLLTMLLSDRLGINAFAHAKEGGNGDTPRSPEADRLREQIRAK